MTKEKFLAIKERYGNVSSFAIWLKDPKTAIRPTKQSWDMSCFVEPKLSKSLEQMRTNIIFVGENISQVPVSKDPTYKENSFVNFHSGSCDYRLMKAFFELPDFYGIYMTDIYKNFNNKVGNDVSDYFKNHQEEEKRQFEAFQEEIDFVADGIEPLFIISGNVTVEAFERFNKDKKYKYISICHYSANGGTAKEIIEKLKGYKK